ncbi:MULTISPECIES: butyrate kinase [Porcincola]|jgi:butyrate kinase|uniref:Probable butyrate kinase n=1 Tax=Porcincola intestinalis TaxID=2606632 RepID=A0A6L5X2R6_9FIRM|nr:butyrate kinase [Porcincola intestinalis]MCI6238258.1 butyrate kinase [Lachnospiraceae bacterium]MCI6697799.1 butyrate kinase [Lachnospiraceae bacterium]MCI6766658.1 butyrate kinase [Lachnospiraceae bacterium]MCI7092862.1 butyrate kinase [Lachnospiraceae bacterium]MDD7060940.1 butyrate kinase [Porcincola intestinalis]
MTRTYRIFIINPGSTSTKLSLFENDKNIYTTDVFHDSKVLLSFPTINDQLDYRMKVIYDFLKEDHIDLTGIDAVVGRGGGCYAVPGGIYQIDERLIADTRAARGGLYHASMLGVQMANEVHQKYGGIMIMMDPPVVDELCDDARITGLKGVYRRAVSHALNLKATARTHAKRMGKRYEDCNFIVCHIDGGISVTAHEHGRMIDGNDAGGGEGPFTPTRMGSLAVTDGRRVLLGRTDREIRDLCSQAGGLSSWFGTSNSDKVHRMVENGNETAIRVWNAMIYQIIKWIGMMSTPLKGQVDAILLTGGLLRFPEIGKRIEESCSFIAPVYQYPGEFEQEAMAAGAMRILTGEEQVKTYPGKPVWSGFDS